MLCTQVPEIRLNEVIGRWLRRQFACKRDSNASSLAIVGTKAIEVSYIGILVERQAAAPTELRVI